MFDWDLSGTEQLGSLTFSCATLEMLGDPVARKAFAREKADEAKGVVSESYKRVQSVRILFLFKLNRLCLSRISASNSYVCLFGLVLWIE